MNNDYPYSLILCILGLTIRNVYEFLKKSERIDSKNKIVFVMVFLAMCMMWAGWFEMCPRDPWRQCPSAPVRWAGLGLVVVGFGLAIGAFIQLRGVENIEHIVSGGLYSRIRHPMYVGFVFWIVGWAAYHGAVVSLMIGLAAMGSSIIYWQKLEDAFLASRFGEKYREYRRGTWF